MTPTTQPAAISLVVAICYWLKLGFISFGGPAGQIALMHAELLERRRWISEQRFMHALNYCMLLPGPEATRDNIRLTAPLTAISAAVVGVILSLTVFFAEHVFKLSLPPSQWEFAALGLAGTACIALFRYKIGAIPLLLACAIAGLVVSYFH